MAYQAKTTINEASVSAFLDKVGNDVRRADAHAVCKLMQKITGQPPRMWGSSIVGFDKYHYQYASGHEGEICMIGFSPRATSLTLYVLPEMPERAALLAKLGKHKTGKGCLYINNLADVDLKVLSALIKTAYAWMQANHR